jgi:hypothetical protein
MDENVFAAMAAELDEGEFALAYVNAAVYSCTPKLRAGFAQTDVYVSRGHGSLQRKLSPGAHALLCAEASLFFEQHKADLSWLHSRFGGHLLWTVRNGRPQYFRQLELNRNTDLFGRVLPRYCDQPGMAEGFDAARERLIAAALALGGRTLYVRDGQIEVGSCAAEVQS